MLRTKDSGFAFLYSNSKSDNDIIAFPSSFNVLTELQRKQPYDSNDYFDMEYTGSNGLRLGEHDILPPNFTTIDIAIDNEDDEEEGDQNTICSNTLRRTCSAYNTNSKDGLCSGDQNCMGGMNMMLMQFKNQYLAGQGISRANVPQQQQNDNTFDYDEQHYTSGLPTPTESAGIIRSCLTSPLDFAATIKTEPYVNNTTLLLSQSGPPLSQSSNMPDLLHRERSHTLANITPISLSSSSKDDSYFTATVDTKRHSIPMVNTRGVIKKEEPDYSVLQPQHAHIDDVSGYGEISAGTSSYRNMVSQWTSGTEPTFNDAVSVGPLSCSMNNASRCDMDVNCHTNSDELPLSNINLAMGPTVDSTTDYQSMKDNLSAGCSNDTNGKSLVKQLLEDPYLSDIIQKPQKRGLYRCAHCPSTFNNIFEYASHLDEYEVERKHKCPFKNCAWRILGLPRRSDLRRHCAIQHKYELYGQLKKDLNLTEDAYPVLRCPVMFCQKEFYRKDAYKRHIAIVNENTSSRFNKRLKRIIKECPHFETEEERFNFIRDKVRNK